MMSVTFPAPEWRDAVRELADRWGCRPGDVMVYALARLIAEGAPRPQGSVEGWQRGGEGLALPRVPGDDR